MSVANLVAPGRQSSANVNVNTLKLAKLTAAERLALTPSDGLMVYDSTSGEVFVYNGVWERISSSPVTGSMMFFITTTAVKNLTAGPAVNKLFDGNTTIVNNTGFTIDPVAGNVTITKTGAYMLSFALTITVTNPYVAGSYNMSITLNANPLLLAPNNIQVVASDLSQSKSLVAVYNLVAGDVIGVGVVLTTTATATVPAGNPAPYEVFFSGSFLG